MYGRKYSLTEYRGLTQKVSGRNDRVVVRQKRLLERSLSKSDDHLRGARGQFWLSRILTRSVVLTGNPTGGGHVFIAEQVDGSTRFIDPQTGSSDCSSYFSMISSGETEILRVDDKDVTDLIKKAVG